ncbi:hypothetical protein L1049_002082 [Liquidambar formosana]|uniref:Transmembrane protein n=1 Tax=Liquidambar formosana TaxID=63359 RepID=A0AAP0NIN9_LIQFO
MAIITKFTAFLLVIIFVANLHALSSTAEPTIAASPAVLPYVASPNMSSFFHSPSSQQPPSFDAPPNLEAFAPVPFSGEFVGRSSSGSAKYGSGIGVFGVGLFFVMKLVYGV